MKNNWVQIFTEDMFDEANFTASKIADILDGDYTVHVRRAIIDWAVRNNIKIDNVSILTSLMQYIDTESVKVLDAHVDILKVCKASKKSDATYLLVLFMPFGPSNIKDLVDTICQKQNCSREMYTINTLVRSKQDIIDMDACRDLVREIFLELVSSNNDRMTSYFYGNAITQFLSVSEMLAICPKESLNSLVMSLTNDRAFGEEISEIIADNADDICDALIAHGTGKSENLEVLVEVLNMIKGAKNIDDLLTSLPVGVRILASETLDWDDVQTSLQNMTIRERHVLFYRKDIPSDFMNRNAGVMIHANFNIMKNKGYV